MTLSEDSQEPPATKRLNGWHRLLVACGIAWAIPIFVFVLITIPFDDEPEIESQWAHARVNLTGEYWGGGELHAALRRRFYGSASDEEIIHSTQPLLGADQLSEPVPVERVQIIDRDYEARIAARRNPMRMPAFALLYWLVPMTALFFFGEALAAFYRAGKSRRQMLMHGGRGEESLELHRATAEHGIGRMAGRLVAWMSLVVIAAVYIMSSLGWFAAMYLVVSGAVPFERRALEVYTDLNPLDHAVRIAQVLSIVAASILLVLEKRIALTLLLAITAAGFLATMIIPRWTISFLSGYSGIVSLVVLSGYVHWLDRMRLYGRVNRGSPPKQYARAEFRPSP